MYIYIYISEVQARTNIQPNGSILYQRKFNTTCYYKGIYVYNMFEKKGTHQASKKYKQLPSTQEATRTTQPEEGKRESDE